MTSSFWNMSPQWNHHLFCMWYWAILAFISLLKYGKHLFILFQKIENSLWACSISSSQRTTCAGYSRHLATLRSARSFGDPMATAKVRRWLAAHPGFTVKLDLFSAYISFSGVTKSLNSLQDSISYIRKGHIRYGRPFLCWWWLSACAWEEKMIALTNRCPVTSYVLSRANWCLLLFACKADPPLWTQHLTFAQDVLSPPCWTGQFFL